MLNPPRPPSFLKVFSKNITFTIAALQSFDALFSRFILESQGILGVWDEFFFFLQMLRM